MPTEYKRKESIKEVNGQCNNIEVLKYASENGTILFCLEIHNT